MRPLPRALYLLIAMALATVGAARPANGQELRGVVRDSASRIPIPGAVVSLLDSIATPVARTMTNDRGQFRVVLLRDGVRRVRIVRLGFRPATTALPAAVDGVIRLDVVMTSIPMALTPVHVNAGPSCPRRADRAQALSLLEQARAGLLATVVARSEMPARMMRLRAVRTMDGLSNRVIHQRVRVDSTGTVFGSFGAARNAGDFVQHGFTADSAGQTMYFGPDAEVLLDDRFAAGYCFHIKAAERSRPDQIGLGFRPASERARRIDVDGALWIDTIARTLVDIEFRYVGTDPRAEPFHPGGRISFREMPNGVVVIDRWSIRIVSGRSGADPFVPVIRSLTEDGRPVARDHVFYGVEVFGELARAGWPDGTRYAAPLATLHLQVVDGEGKPLPGTIVRLADTDYEAIADSVGNLELPDLLPGPYAVSIVDPALAELGIAVPTPLEFTAARGWAILTRLPVSAIESYVADRCRSGGGGGQRSQPVAGAVWLVGRIVSEDGRPIPGARWTLRLNNLLGEQRVVKDAEVGSDGVFQYCQLRHGESVVLSVRAKDMAEKSVTVAMTKQPTVVTVVLQPRYGSRR